MAPILSLETIRSKIGLSGRAGIWKFFALLLALLNLKNLPFVWHLRLLKGLITHLRSSRVRLASRLGPSALFQPMITSHRSGFLECDYNFHKSNSTYFSDFDVGRLELLVSLGTHGIEKVRKDLAKDGNKEPFALILGSVSCNFRREIKPYEGFEIWTRLLTWDQKWMYVISHFVKKGAVKPKRYTLQPWRKVGDKDVKDSTTGNRRTGPHPAIFAAGISKYVWKKGRLTIPPERVIQASELLPPKPADHETPPISMAPNTEAVSSTDTTATSIADNLTPANAGEVMAASLTANDDDNDEWTWERVEEERKRGMKIAEIYNSLDLLNEEFRGEGGMVLGSY